MGATNMSNNEAYREVVQEFKNNQKKVTLFNLLTEISSKKDGKKKGK